ncbi:unnamed protein product [Prorocentrum cordatum]|uniref:FHA domain-containing protein n=1 Tax=Prorocentrum cordatum TaxID=2364126 RepID=A0ABN9SF69_9DINO|nr:unnamed protein product [Polarella glacialis]
MAATSKLQRPCSIHVRGSAGSCARACFVAGNGGTDSCTTACFVVVWGGTDTCTRACFVVGKGGTDSGTRACFVVVRGSADSCARVCSVDVRDSTDSCTTACFVVGKSGADSCTRACFVVRRGADFCTRACFVVGKGGTDSRTRACFVVGTGGAESCARACFVDVRGSACSCARACFVGGKGGTESCARVCFVGVRGSADSRGLLGGEGAFGPSAERGSAWLLGALAYDCGLGLLHVPAGRDGAAPRPRGALMAAPPLRQAAAGWPRPPPMQAALVAEAERALRPLLAPGGLRPRGPGGALGPPGFGVPRPGRPTWVAAAEHPAKGPGAPPVSQFPGEGLAEEDVEEWLRAHGVDESAQAAVLQLSSCLQRQLMQECGLDRVRNPSAFLMRRVRDMRNGHARAPRDGTAARVADFTAPVLEVGSALASSSTAPVPPDQAPAPRGRESEDPMKAFFDGRPEKSGGSRAWTDAAAEVEAYLSRNGIGDHQEVARLLRDLLPEQQRQVMESDLADARDRVAALRSRISKVRHGELACPQRHASPGGASAGTGWHGREGGEARWGALASDAARPAGGADLRAGASDEGACKEEVEAFLSHSGIDEDASWSFRKLSPELQRLVMETDLSIGNVRNPSAYLLSLVGKARRGELGHKRRRGPGAAGPGAGAPDGPVDHWGQTSERPGQRGWSELAPLPPAPPPTAEGRPPTLEDARGQPPAQRPHWDEWGSDSLAAALPDISAAAEGQAATAALAALPGGRPQPDRGVRDAAGGGSGDDDLELGVEGFLRHHGIDAKACQAVRALPPELKREMLQSDPSEMKNPSAFVMRRAQRLREEAQGAAFGRGPADPQGGRDALPLERDAPASVAKSSALPGCLPGSCRAGAKEDDEMLSVIDTIRKLTGTLETGREARGEARRSRSRDERRRPRARGGEDAGAAFVLRRLDGPAGLPAAVPVFADSRPLSIGRGVSSDLALPVQHISKAHALLTVLQAADGSRRLMLEDTSSNGTWLNEKQVTPNRHIEVKHGDVISFLPPPSVSGTDAMPPTYEVVEGSRLKAARGSAGALGRPRTARRDRSGGRGGSGPRSRSRSSARAVAAARQAHDRPPRGGVAHSDPYGGGGGADGLADPARQARSRGHGPAYDLELGRPPSRREPALGEAGAAAAAGAGAGGGRAAHPAVSTEETSVQQWLQSLGLGPDAEELCGRVAGMYVDLRQIRNLYGGESPDDFFEDCAIESPAHQEVFRRALERLQASPP